MDGAVCISLDLGSETRAGFSTCSAVFAAIKEALWHADTGYVRADDPRPLEIQAGTGISWPCQVWYLTARLTLLGWKSLSIKFASACRSEEHTSELQSQFHLV